MMNDSIREELFSKISKPLQMDFKENYSVSGELKLSQKANVTDKMNHIEAISTNSSIKSDNKQITSEINSKPTSPTLIEFHNKNSNVPEWRLQLQNVVRQRQERENSATDKTISSYTTTTATRKTKLATNGANALIAEIIEEKKPALAKKNPTLNSALERIEKSRQKFLVSETEDQFPEEAPTVTVNEPRPASKNYPFYIASKQTEISQKQVEQNSLINSALKPTLTPPFSKEGQNLDTNKLPSLPLNAKIESSFDKTPAISLPKTETKIEEKVKAEIKPVLTEEVISVETDNYEEFDDCAPFSMRFNAGLFDFIICAFLSLLLLAPFMLMGGEWFTFTGALAFLATCSIVMFIYFTTTIGFYGRTFGMRMFSLEVVDIEGEHYPTLHQAAVSSAVYLLSLALGGIGFLTLPFNEDRRAVHDLVSGTIVVKES